MNRTAKRSRATTGAGWLFMIAVASLGLAAASTWSQEAAKPATDPPPQSSQQKPDAPAKPVSETEVPPAPGAAKASETATSTDPAKPEGAEEPAGAEAPRRFIPSQKASADNSATFPIDI